MRSDMAKVICERERANGRYVHDDKGLASRYQNRNAEDDFDNLDSLPRHESMFERHRSNYKSFNENLEPLRRFLESQVGRPWNKVQSEMQKIVSKESTIHRHVWGHVKDFVSENVVVLIGQKGLFERRPASRYVSSKEFTPIKESRVYLFVDPRTGLLRKNRDYHGRWGGKKTFQINDRPEPVRKDTKDPMVQLHRLHGLWYEVTLEAFETLPEGSDFATKCSPKELLKVYGRDKVWGVAKRSLGSKELRRLGLVNDQQEAA